MSNAFGQMLDIPICFAPFSLLLPFRLTFFLSQVLPLFLEAYELIRSFLTLFVCSFFPSFIFFLSFFLFFLSFSLTFSSLPFHREVLPRVT